jgi:hypothetical protein
MLTRMGGSSVPFDLMDFSGDFAMSLKVLFATYGALPNGNQADAQGFIVTKALQRLIDNTGGIVAINNTSFNDPVVNFEKHFGAVVVRDGVQRCFACQEGQTINFNVAGGTTQE